MLDYDQSPWFAPGAVSQLSTELQTPSPLFFGHDIAASFPDYLGLHQFDRLFIFIDRGIMAYHGVGFHAMCVAAFGDAVELTVLPEGEAAKTFDMLEQVCEQLIAAGASKRSILLALGGGAVCNVVGLAAGLLYRGVRYIEVPTTMTGQTDSCLSNKQAINGKNGKNHFGLYHAPLFIWNDTGYLLSEPARSKRSGLVEAIKNGFISSPDFLEHLKTRLNPELRYTAEQLHALVFDIIESKLAILRKDPSEKGMGIILEYGHTFGHGMEWMARQHGASLTHGEAVSFGMRIAAQLSCRLNLISAETAALHAHIIEDRLGVDMPLPDYIATEGLISAMLADNKKTGKEMRFVLLEDIGKCFNPEGDYLSVVDLDIVREVLDEFICSHRAMAAA